MDLDTLGLGAAFAVVFVIGLLLVKRSRARAASGAAAWESAVAEGRHIPSSLHPLIDTDLCIGSLSCLMACPEGDILGIVDNAARLIHAGHCIGHGRCASECPVGAIKLVFGTAERGIDLPDLDGTFESSRRGVHVVGELGGMGLIKNAIRQGIECAEYLRARLDRKPAPGTTDVVIVGAGPAGLATALGCRHEGLSFRVLEQATLGGTVANYPRQKVVMTEAVELPIFGRFGKQLISKEELLASFRKLTEKGQITVEEGVKVEGIEGQDGAFVVQTSKGRLRARKVVLAVGRRGSPRKLGVAGEEGPRVTYSLADPGQYDGCKVLVVGGGDSAIEAAVQLAEESSATVHLSYRGPALARAKQRNLEKITALAAQGRVKLLLGTTVKALLPGIVVLDPGGAPLELPNDFVLAALGGEPPIEFLKKAGVSMTRARGDVEAPPPAVKGSARPDEERAGRRLPLFLFSVALVVVASLAAIGADYYGLSHAERIRSPLHAALRPAGVWGHGIGLVATLVMLSNFLYPVRKRWRRLKRTGNLRTWLAFHVFVGFMSPAVIAFHSAFQSRNTLATATSGALGIVVATGILGRFLYALVPTKGGHVEELSELSARWERLKHRILPMLGEVADRGPLERIVNDLTGPPRGSMLAGIAEVPLVALRTHFRLLLVRKLFKTREQYQEFAHGAVRLGRLRTQVAFYKGLRRLLSVWRVFHAVLAGFLVVAITLHIGVSLYLGYGWILF